MSETERKPYSFVVKSYGEGTPWIKLDYLDEDLSCLSKGYLGFDLKKESHKRVSEIVDYLNEHIEFVTFQRT